MLFTWDTTNLCIVFRSWHIRSTTSLLFSLVGVALLTAGYEAIREASRRYEAHVAKSVDELPRKPPAPSPQSLLLRSLSFVERAWLRTF